MRVAALEFPGLIARIQPIVAVSMICPLDSETLCSQKWHSRTTQVIALTYPFTKPIDSDVYLRLRKASIKPEDQLKETEINAYSPSIV